MSASPITVREACPEDVEDLVPLIGRLFDIEPDFSFDPEKVRQGLTLLLAHREACILVGDLNGRAVGMCTGQLTISTAEGEAALLVEDVVIREEWRGQGLGRRLMEALAAWAVQRGANRLQLLADRNNHPGLSFYRRLGWKSTTLICLRRYTDEKSGA